MRSLKSLMDLSGRAALVTGGSGHIGAAICEALAELGASIAVLDVDGGMAEKVAENLRREFGVDSFALGIDLADQNAVRSVSRKVFDRFRRLDILINCAAFVGTSTLDGWAVPFGDQNPDTWRAALEVNLTAPFVLIQSCADYLKASGHGSIINIASIYGVVGPDLSLYEGTSMGNPAAYAASKGGLLQFTRWLATVLAPNIRVNAVTPGGVLRGQRDSFRERYIAGTPLKRMATEEDMKGAVAYLASDLSAYVTGQNLIVDGGWTAW